MRRRTLLELVANGGLARLFSGRDLVAQEQIYKAVAGLPKPKIRDI
jgi:hypothetical protein